MSERPRSQEETTETSAERTPEQTVGVALEASENGDATDPIISLEWVRNCRDWIGERRDQIKQGYNDWADEHKKTAAVVEGSANVAILAGIGYVKITKFSIFKFLKKFIQKKGKMTFKEGFEIGEEMFSSEVKKEKK